MVRKASRHWGSQRRGGNAIHGSKDICLPACLYWALLVMSYACIYNPPCYLDGSK